ncbi:hypothetical protein ACHAXS_004163 [Conticribra weissflogii]
MSSTNHLLAASSCSPSPQNSPSHTTSPSFASTFPPHQPMNKVLQAAIANSSMASYISRYSRTSTESGSACNDSLVVPSFTIHASGDTINEGSFNYQSFSPSKNENISPSNNKTEPSAKPSNIHGKSTDSQNSNTEFDATTDNIKPTKCAIKACPKYSAGAEKVMCTRNGCGRIIHQLCSDRLVITQHKLFPLEGCYFCTKSCYGKFERDTLSVRLTWENDGKNGRNDPNTSANLLVNWLANQNNYNLWRGDTSGERMGLTKTEIATNLAKMLNDSGVKVRRTTQTVRCKIENIESQMRLAFDWESSVTGAGLKERDPQGSFHESLLQKCKYFDVLDDTFRDRAAF